MKNITIFGVINMKKINLQYFVLVLLVSVLVGCGVPQVKRLRLSLTNTTPTYIMHSPRVRTIVIDGCQYLESRNIIRGDSSHSLTHKGNCTNSIHYMRK